MANSIINLHNYQDLQAKFIEDTKAQIIQFPEKNIFSNFPEKTGFAQIPECVADHILSFGNSTTLNVYRSCINNIPNWELNIKNVAKRAHINKDTARIHIRKLKTQGYITHEVIKNSNGTYKKGRYRFFAFSINNSCLNPANPCMTIPCKENPVLENPVHNNTNNNNIHKTTTLHNNYYIPKTMPQNVVVQNNFQLDFEEQLNALEQKSALQKTVENVTSIDVTSNTSSCRANSETSRKDPADSNRSYSTEKYLDKNHITGDSQRIDINHVLNPSKKNPSPKRNIPPADIPSPAGNLHSIDVNVNHEKINRVIEKTKHIIPDHYKQNIKEILRVFHDRSETEMIKRIHDAVERSDGRIPGFLNCSFKFNYDVSHVKYENYTYNSNHYNRECFEDFKKRIDSHHERLKNRTGCDIESNKIESKHDITHEENIFHTVDMSSLIDKLKKQTPVIDPNYRTKRKYWDRKTNKLCIE